MFVKAVNAPRTKVDKGIRFSTVTLEDANPSIKETMRKLGKTALRDDQVIAHYQGERGADWQTIVDKDFFVEKMERFPGYIRMDASMRRSIR